MKGSSPSLLALAKPQARSSSTVKQAHPAAAAMTGIWVFMWYWQSLVECTE
jgi:hypothetical protein